MVGHSAARLAAVRAGFLVLLLILTGRALGEWQVPEAAIRYKLDLERKPTHPSAGYFVHLPDGGILRGTIPATVVMTEDGKVLPSYLLWHNPESGFSIVFADPGNQARPVYVYIQPTRLAQLWRPDTGLTPSALLCAYPGRDTVGAARALAKFGQVDPVVHSVNEAGIPKAPLSIGGDLTGRPRPGAFYLLSYVNAPVAGSYWIAPFIRNGQGEILIDGNQLYPKEHSKVWGGTGAFMDLTAGLHRVEVFQTGPGTGPYSSNMNDGGLMFLAWRVPKEQPLKNAEARVINDSEIVRSGFCNLTGLESHDGGPVAAGKASSGLVYWFESEEPLLIYDLSAYTAGQPAGATYTWTFPEGAILEGPKVQWIFPGFREGNVKLTVKSGQAASACTISFFSFGVGKTDLQKPAHREAFRNVLTAMLEAFPHNRDPVVNWSEAWLNNLLRTVEAGEGYPLLLRLFTDHTEAVRRKLSAAQLTTLQDLFLDEAQHENPRETLQWLQRFQPNLDGSPRQLELKLREGELQMYSLGDRKQAEAIFTALAGVANDYGERARIRLGDLAFMAGDLNKATSLYADVQNRARARRNATPGVSGTSVADQFAKGGAAKPAVAPATPAASVVDLKGGALQEVSLSENVRSLIDDGYLLEARQALGTWEREFPLSKISSDYIIRESALYIKMGDWKRAQPMLEAYCREIDASSYLPDAASMLITCVTNAKESPDSIREIIEKVKGRLKFHPVAAQLDRFLSTTGKK